MFCSIDHIWDVKGSEFKAKIIIQNRIELVKFLYVLTMTKNMYLKIDSVSYHIFINVLFNHKN